MGTVVENIYNDLQDSWVEEFIALIQVEVRAYKSLLNKLEVQKFAIIDRDVLQMTELTDDAEQYMAEAQTASLKRIEKLTELSKHIRPSKELQSIEQVIPICKRQYVNRLQELRQSLLDTLQKIKSTNQLNHYLLNKSLDFVNKNLELIYSEFGQYDYHGNSNKFGKQVKLPTLTKTI